MESLLRELVSNVLSRLPTKELMRCKCVCKSWFDLITNPHFISNYYVFYNSRGEQERLLLIRTLSHFWNETEISVISWKSNEPIGPVSSRIINPPPYKFKLQDSIMGPCNGIYFVEGDLNVIMNPSLRQFIVLPRSDLVVPCGTFSRNAIHSFGFDPKTNDYKVVALKKLFLEETHEQLMGDWAVELYSLNSNSWRDLGANVIPSPFATFSPSRYYTNVNNCCHWLGFVYESREDEDFVLSFDMVSELFKKIKRPQITHSSGWSSITLIPFSESDTIGLLDYYLVDQGTKKWFFDVWMMKEYLDEGSWIKRYSVGPLPIFISKEFVGYYESDQFLWKDVEQERLLLYGLDCEEHIKDLCVYKNQESITAVRYMESLVSLKRGNQDKKEKREEIQGMECLLRELVSNVLSRLPAKELMQCKCVCKSWFDLISDPYFISSYYVFYNSREVQQQDHLLLIHRHNYLLYSKETKISIISWNSDEPEGLVYSQVINHPPYQYNSWGDIMGPCNGIYFLEGSPNIIMNPSLRQFIALPEYHFTGPDETFSLHVYLRFGFDPKTNDYKVVALKDIWLKERLMGVWRVELYSLNSNSWRDLGTNVISFPFEIGDSSECFTYVNNCCHWWGSVYESDKKEDVVLSFDMVNELFRKIKVPIISHSSGKCTNNLIPLSEFTTIGIIDFRRGRGTCECPHLCFCFFYYFDVWVMKDYWDEASWIKRYGVNPIPITSTLLIGYYGSNQFLWKHFDAYEGRRLVLHGLDCEENFRDLWDYFGFFESVKVARYMESIVSLQRGNQSLGIL